MSQTIIYKANTRGHADHGWLNSYHTFSFANYYAPERMNFGALRVLNDDTVAPGMGFGLHPHDNMEIISIPLEGDLEHRDSMDTTQVIKHGDIQIMSAGTGITHSEMNKSKENPVKFLQIWIIPKVENIKPSYGQITLHPEDRKNKLQQIISPIPSIPTSGEEKGMGSLLIHQESWFHLGKFDKDFSVDYAIKKPGNGVYVFILKGALTIAGNALNERDGIGIWDTDKFTIKSNTQDAEVLLMEVPMDF